ncbi:MAG: hypothetical protein Q9161_008646 [Pseudevernia consocians]
MEYKHLQMSADIYRFRWVECQFQALQSCPRSEEHLDRLLSSLPRSLDETCERMLCDIEYPEDARRILTLLCFASRPLSVQELIDGVAVEINSSEGLNRKRRLQDSNAIRDICGSLIDIGLDVDHSTEELYGEELTPTVRIAHFSVQEYLESDRIRHQKAEIFSLRSAMAHDEIAHICLVYLLDHGLSRSELDRSILKEYPLAHFAAMYWYRHYQMTPNPTPALSNCISRLFQSQDSFTTWVRLHDVDDDWDIMTNFSRPLDDIPSPVYYASLLGLDQTLHEILNTQEVESTITPAQSVASASKVSKQINARGGSYSNALQAALVKGHDEIVQILLDRGAEIYVRDVYERTALQMASSKGHNQIVEMLLDRGANVNARDDSGNTALHAASYRGHDKIVQILLDRGAKSEVYI